MLGAVFPLASSPHALVLSGIGLAASGAVSMGGGELLAEGTDTGLAASAAIGLTTGLGTLVPIVPYMVIRNHPAVQLSLSIFLCLMVAFVISVIKSADRDGMSLRRAATQTYGTLLVAGAFTLLAAWATGAVG